MRSALARNSVLVLSTDDERIAKATSGLGGKVALMEPGTQWQAFRDVAVQ
jgi:hypothetical protein